MFTTLTVAMALSGAVAVETPARITEAAHPALVQLAANATITGGGKKEFGNAKGSNPAKPVYGNGEGSNGKPTGYSTGTQHGYGNGVGSSKPAGYPTGTSQGYGNGVGSNGKPTGYQTGALGNAAGPVTILPKEPVKGYATGNQGGPVISPPAGNGAPPPSSNGLSIDQIKELTEKKS